ncbi:hypothetical protein [Bradyrhizobium sp.]|uniref:hypothetical protein n=1 Tax=Bradyrhizobium sp. TaxID=376 RepID=UPI0025BE31A6|nr:hypothetical protein [Bradyrhizobium sp.]
MFGAGKKRSKKKQGRNFSVDLNEIAGGRDQHRGRRQAGVQFWDISDGKHSSGQYRSDSGAGFAAPHRNHFDPLRRNIGCGRRRDGAAVEPLIFGLVSER